MDDERSSVEEYLLYVRIPDDLDLSVEETADFVERVARLLSDDDAKIYVESARTFDENDPKDRTRGIHEFDGEGWRGNSAAGGDKSSAQPMYFCHGKF